jgi:5-methylcytosine-specific restriction endonuclease McrA
MSRVVYPTGYRWIEKNPERHAENGRRWRRQHPARALQISRWRQERIKRATPAWLTAEHWDAMDAVYIHARAATETTGVAHHVDHIHPIAGRNSCGLHVPWNLQVLTGLDNRRKGAKLADSFAVAA